VRRSIALGAAMLFPLAAAAAALADAPRTARSLPTAIVDIAPGPPAAPGPPLDADRLGRLRQAEAMRRAGRLDAARVAAAALLAEVPHHPLLLAELANIDLERQDFAAVERLARAERFSQKDSVLLGTELCTAYERLGRVRDAAQTAVEMWVAAPLQGDWAGATLLRLAPADPRGVRDALRRAVDRAPTRPDLAGTLGRLEWNLGDLRGMLRALTPVDRAGMRPPLRWRLADELLRSGSSRDSTGAIESLLDVAGDGAVSLSYRVPSARRAWEALVARGADLEGAPRVARALRDLPPARWDPEFLVDVVRGLRRAGLTADARTLLDPLGTAANLPPALGLERALNDLREGPVERALAALRSAARGSAEAAFRYAEALFYSGQPDSASAWYQAVAQDPSGPFTGAALERLFLIEDASPREALPSFGSVAYAVWRGDTKRALALTDSLYHALPRNALWAHAALMLADQRLATGDDRGALEPLLMVADSLDTDRLAPLARQRAGDVYLTRLQDGARALAQYEECLTRYPKAWNAPEVRRKLEQLRRDRRL